MSESRRGESKSLPAVRVLRHGTARSRRGGGAQGRDARVLRCDGLDGARRAPGSGVRALGDVGLLRDRAGRARAAWRDGREVHRRRGDGGRSGSRMCARTTPCAACAPPRELRARLRDVRDEVEARYGVGIAVRIGVNTGEVVAGDAAAGQAFASGDAVNVAARLEQAAAPGEVLLGEATLRLVRDAVDGRGGRAARAQGQVGAVAAWRLLEVAAGEAGVSRRLDAPLVGRDARARAAARCLASQRRRARGAAS